MSSCSMNIKKKGFAQWELYSTCQVRSKNEAEASEAGQQ